MPAVRYDLSTGEEPLALIDPSNVSSISTNQSQIVQSPVQVANDEGIAFTARFAQAAQIQITNNEAYQMLAAAQTRAEASNSMCLQLYQKVHDEIFRKNQALEACRLAFQEGSRISQQAGWERMEMSDRLRQYEDHINHTRIAIANGQHAYNIMEDLSLIHI